MDPGSRHEPNWHDVSCEVLLLHHIFLSKMLQPKHDQEAGISKPSRCFHNKYDKSAEESRYLWVFVIFVIFQLWPYVVSHSSTMRFSNLLKIER